MSISDEIEKYIKSGKLIDYKVGFRSPSINRRRLLMMEEAYKECPPTGNTKKGLLNGQGLGQARVGVANFINGDELLAGQHIKKLSHSSLSDVWELKNQIGSSGASRLFGFFVEKDCYIATHFQLRQKLEKTSGSKWNKEMEKVITKREKIIPTLRVHSNSSGAFSTTTNYDFYISNWT